MDATIGCRVGEGHGGGVGGDVNLLKVFESRTIDTKHENINSFNSNVVSKR